MNNTQNKAAGTVIQAADKTSLCKCNYTPETLPLVVIKNVARADSRILAGHLGVKHKNTFGLILKFENEFQGIDQLLFKTTVGKRIQGGGNAERYALLSEDQAFFLLALSRNSERVVRLKMGLVQAFRRARDGVVIGKEYLPGYHALHDEVKRLAEAAKTAGSKTPERLFYISINKMLNAAMGLKSGRRASLTPQVRTALYSANCIAQKAIQQALDGGGDHYVAYAEAKRQVEGYARGASLLLEAS